MQTDTSELYFLQDKIFKLPNVEINFMIYIPGEEILENKKGLICFSLFHIALDMYLKEFLYMAEMAEISVSTFRQANGFHIKIRSYSHKLKLFIQELSQRLANFSKLNSEIEASLKEKLYLKKNTREENLKNFFKKKQKTDHMM